MNRYLVLLKFTSQGARAISRSVSRAKSFTQVAAKSGVTVESQYWALGRYDGVLILSSEGDSALKLVAKLASLGNVQTETLPLLDATGFARITKG